MTGNKIIELLSKVDPTTSMWGQAIHDVVQTKDAGKVIELVIELKSQGRDDRNTLAKIIGNECCDLILAI